MATNLKRMKIREVSCVDVPASPGADIILMKQGVAPPRLSFDKRDVSSEPRDGHGRWTAGQVAGAAAATAAAGAALYFGGPHLARAARHAAASAAVLHAVSTHGAPPSALAAAARGAGAATASAAKATGRFLSDNAGKVSAVLAPAAVAAAKDFKVKSVKQVKGGVRVNVESKVAGVKATNHFDVKPRQLLGAARSVSGVDQANAEGSAHPSNGEPIVTSRTSASNSAKIPLNSPGINWRNAGGWSYKTQTGQYIPSGSSDQQKFIEENLGQAGYHLHVASPATSGGAAYRTQNGNIVPAGSREGQLKMEERYALERQRTTLRKCGSLFSDIPRPRLIPAVAPTKLFT